MSKKNTIIEKVADAQKQTMVQFESLPLLTIGVAFDLKDGIPDLRNCFKKPLLINAIDGVTPEMINTALVKALSITNKEIVKKAKTKKLN